MPPFLYSLTAKLIGVALIAVLAAAGAGWTVHKVDAADYEALQLADANALNEQMTKDQAAAQAFNERAATAMEATTGLLAQLKTQRATQAQQLTQVFTTEGTKDANLAGCLAMTLPNDVINQLAK